MPSVHQVFALAVIVNTLHLLGLGTYSAASRAGRAQRVNPEDPGGDDAETTFGLTDNPVTARIGRAHRNSLENIPVFLISARALARTGWTPQRS